MRDNGFVLYSARWFGVNERKSISLAKSFHTHSTRHPSHCRLETIVWNRGIGNVLIKKRQGMRTFEMGVYL